MPKSVESGKRRRTKRIRVAVAGLGRIGWTTHARSLGAHPDFELIAVADREPSRREEAVAAFGCRAYDDYDRMILESALDTVVIATPTHLHKPHALLALRNGVHVILEKPMARDYSESAAIVRAAQRRKRILTVYQPHRLMAYFQQLASIVRSGRIGRITRVEIGMFRYIRRNDWQSLLRYGGGMLGNYGAHALDQILQLIGYDVKKVSCCMQRVLSLGDAEDCLRVTLQTRGGAIGGLDINEASAVKPYNIIIWGTCGSLETDRQHIVVRWFDPKKLPEKCLEKKLASSDRKYPSENIQFNEETIPIDESYNVDVYADFARAIRKGAEPFVKPRETLALMRLMDRCREWAGPIPDLRSP